MFSLSAWEELCNLWKQDFLQQESAGSDKFMQQWHQQVQIFNPQFCYLHYIPLLQLIVLQLFCFTCSVTVQCTYPLAGLRRLFSLYRFESDTDGVGCIFHSAHANKGRWFAGLAAETASLSYVWAFGLLYSRSTESDGASNSSTHY